MKRVLSLLLSLALCLSFVPTTAYAEENTSAAEPVEATESAENEAPDGEIPAEEPAGEVPEEAPTDEPEAPTDEDLSGNAEAEAEETGTCGKNATWNLSNGTLTISGTGAMWDYEEVDCYGNTTSPWSDSRKEITGVVIGSGITYIGNYAFNYCTSLKTVTFASGSKLTGIGSFAFCHCVLEAIQLPTGVTRIGTCAFASTSLTTVAIPAGVTSIGDEVFAHCYDLNSVTFASGSKLTSIESMAFYSCTALKAIQIPTGVTSIGAHAFDLCYSMTKITVPAKVGSIGEAAFSQCTSLTSITVDASNTVYSSANGVLFNKAKTKLIQYPAGKTDSSYTIPSGVKSIGDDAFENCGNLSSVVIPSSVTSIGEFGFSGCQSLTEVTFSSGSRLEKIGESAFGDCTSLADFTIPENVTSIGDSAFISNPLSFIVIPSGVTSLGDKAFAYCDNLNTIQFTGNAPAFEDSSGNGNSCFMQITATVYYPVGDATWTADVRQSYGGIITWVAGVPSAPTEVLNATVVGYPNNNFSNILLKWDKVENAVSYDIYRAVGMYSHSFTKLANVKNCSYSDSSVTNGEVYRYYVVAIGDGVRYIDSEASNTVTIYRLSRPVISHINCVSKGVNIQWNGNGKAEGVNIYRSDNGGEFKLVYTGDYHSGNWTDETANVNGTRYQYRLLFHRTFLGVIYSSTYVSATKYYLKNSTLTTTALASGGVKLSWTKNTAVTGYKLYRSTDNKNFTLVKTVTSPKTTTWTDTSAVKGTKYYYKMVGYVKVNGTVYNGAFSGTKTVTAK